MMMLLNNRGELQEPRERRGTDGDLDGDVAASDSAGSARRFDGGASDDTAVNNCFVADDNDGAAVIVTLLE